MNKFRFYFFLFCSVSILFSCNKSDGADEIPIRDFDVQYQSDMDIIRTFLTEHSIHVDATTHEVTMPLLVAGQVSMMSQFVGENEIASATAPYLTEKTFEYNDKPYKIYYMKLSADNPTGKQPTSVDGVLSSYRGSYLYYNTTTTTPPVTTTEAKLFEYTPFPVDFLRLDTSIRGWTEIFPFFKAGNSVVGSGSDPITYTNFGEGAIFIPSGFAYFNQARTSLSGITLPSYSALVFTFKLYDVKNLDQDEDGILSNDEDLNNNKIFTDDDTDGDGIQNLYDIDDDGDGYYTKSEIHKDTAGNIIFEDTDGDGIANYLDKDNPRNN